MTHAAADDLAQKFFGPQARAVLLPGDDCRAGGSRAAAESRYRIRVLEGQWPCAYREIGKGNSWEEAIARAKNDWSE